MRTATITNKPVLFVEIGTTPVVRLNSSPLNIDWNSSTWIGAGVFGGVERITDKPGEYESIRFTLSGVPQDALALALSEDIRGKDCTVYLAFLHDDTEAVVDVTTLWTGNMDRMPIQHTPSKDGNPGSILIGAEAIHAGAQMARSRPLRFTAEDTKKISATDTSGRFLLSQAQESLAWPSASYFKK